MNTTLRRGAVLEQPVLAAPSSRGAHVWAGLALAIGLLNGATGCGQSARHNVIYDGNGNDAGAPPVDGHAYASGDSVTTLGNNGGLARSGKVFAGWTTNPTPSGPSSSHAPGSTWKMGTSDVTLSAIWLPENLTFASVGTSVSITGTILDRGTGGALCPKGAFAVPPGVTEIRSQGLSFCVDMTSVAIPSSVIALDSGIFVGCDSLTDITVDPTNPSFSSADGAVLDKSKATLLFVPGGLTSYVIPDAVATIGENAFSWCHLESITIPPAVTSIGAGAFNGCRELASVTLSPGVTSIGYLAFGYCGMTSVTLPATVTTLGLSVFHGCSAMTGIEVDSANPSFSSLSGVLYDKSGQTLIEAPGAVTSLTIPSTVTTIGDGAFSGCTSLTSVAIPSSVAIIGPFAFDMCTSLASITIPSSVTSIGDSAFFCAGLTGVTMQSTAPPTLGEAVFDCLGTQYPPSTYPIHVPTTGAVTAYGNAPRWSEYSSRIVCP